MIKKHLSPWRTKLVLSLCILTLVSSFSMAQNTAVFSKRELSVIHLGAMEKLAGYEDVINQIRVRPKGAVKV